MAHINSTLGTTSSPLSWLKAPSSALACGALALLLATTALPQHAAAQVTDQQIDDFIKANAGNPDAIAQAMKEHNVDVNRIKQATGHSQETIDKYVDESNSDALKEITNRGKKKSTDQGDVAQQQDPSLQPQGQGDATPAVTDQQIDAFVRAHGDDPKAIADAMKQYDVDLARIQKATGFSRDEMTNYINNSRDNDLKLALVDWPHERTGNTDFDKLPEFMKAGVFSGQPTVVIRDASEIDKLPFWSSMHPDSVKFYKNLLQERLDAGEASSTGMSVTGIMGYQIRIPDKGNPERTYPPISASELATMKDELKRVQEPAIAAQKVLLTCLDTGKSDCAKERTAYDAVRLPSIYQATKVQIAEFERTQLTTTNSNELFFASITPSLTAHNAFLQCAQTAKVTKASCDEHSELAIDMSKKVEALSKNVYEECVKTYGGSNTPQCRPLYMQYDAQRSNTSKLTQRINEFKAEEYADNTDRPKLSIATPPAPISNNNTKEWFALEGYDNNYKTDPVKLTGKLNGLSQADYNRITSGNYNVSELSKLDPADQIAAVLRYRQSIDPDVATNQAVHDAVNEVFKLNGATLSSGKDLDNISYKGADTPDIHAVSGLYVDGKYIGTPYTTNWNSTPSDADRYKMAVQYLRDAQAANKAPGDFVPATTYSNKEMAAFDLWNRSEDLTKPRDYNTWVKLGRPGLDKLQQNAASANAAQAKPTTLTLPAEGKTRALANGYSINSGGTIKNAKGLTIAALGEDGVFRNAAGKPVRAGTAQTLTKLVAETPKATPSTARRSTPIPNETARRSTPIPNDRSALGGNADDSAEQKNAYVAETDKNGSFYGDNNSDLSGEVSKLKLPENSAVANKDGSIITNAELNSFIRANLDDPRAIANTMKKYGADLNRIQEATGYTRDEMVDYIKKSKNTYLKGQLKKWADVKPIVEPKPPTLETGQPTLTKPTPMLPPRIPGKPMLPPRIPGKPMLPPKQNPDEECGIDGSRCKGFPVPKSKPIPLPRQNPDEECGIDGSRCKGFPVPKSKPIPLPRQNPDEECGIDGSRCKGFPVPKSKPIPLPRQNPDEECGIDGSRCKPAPETY